MKLITPELEKRFAEIGNQSENENPRVIAKFFDPVGSATWYATNYNTDTKICYGYVTGLAYDEWGTFSIDELERIKRPFGLGIERDVYFKEIPFNELRKQQRLNQMQKGSLENNQESAQDIE